MSNTIRKIIRLKKREYPASYFDTYSNATEIVEVDDTQARHQLGGWNKPKKLAPYSKNMESKFKRENIRFTNMRNTSHSHKEEVKNANRSLKKGLRQGFKKEIQNELNNYYEK